MIIDSHIMQEYPFDGMFYNFGVDESKPLNERVEEEIIILETKCDIQAAQKEDSGVISNAYNVYFPFDTKVGLPAELKKGKTKFRGNMFGYSVDEAIVVDVFPSQLGGCQVYVKQNG